MTLQRFKRQIPPQRRKA